MTKRENILLQILLLLCCSCFFYFTFSSSFSVISQSKKGITEYETMLNKIKSTVTDTITEDVLTDEVYEADFSEITVSDIAEMIINDLKKAGITPQKYQIIDSSNGGIIDTSIKCTHSQLTRYLFNIEEKDYPYTISNISIKTGKENVTSTIRYSLNTARIVNPVMIENKSNLEKLFRPVSKPVVTKTVVEKKTEEPIEELPEVIENGNDTYRFIGSISENEGESFLYVKNVNANRIYKIPLNEVLEDNGNEYVLFIDNKKVLISKGQ